MPIVIFDTFIPFYSGSFALSHKMEPCNNLSGISRRRVVQGSWGMMAMIPALLLPVT